MFGCLFRLARVMVFLVVFALIGGAVYFYTQLHPEKAPWKDGAAVVQNKMATAALTVQVKAALSLREALKDLPVTVSSEKDVVTLRGGVPSFDAAKAVEVVAASVPGVRQVVNLLEVDPNLTPGKQAPADDRSIGERVDDEALELKVRAAFKLDRALAEAGFEVKAVRRVVHLTSASAAPAQKEHALQVARSVEGVSSVELR